MVQNRSYVPCAVSTYVEVMVRNRSSVPCAVSTYVEVMVQNRSCPLCSQYLRRSDGSEPFLSRSIPDL